MDTEEFRSHIARWVDERLVPVAHEMDRKGDFPLALFRELGGLGYYGTMYPEEHGGSGIENPFTCFSILCEELARGNMGFAATVCMQASTATWTLYRWGSDALRKEYLEPAIRGEKIGAFAITEPNAGSDAAALRTRAEKAAGGYRLTGTKIFTTNGTVADFITVAARPAGEKKIGLFLVDTKSKGFSVGRRLDKFSVNCSDTGELVFDGVFVPEARRLGGGEDAFLNAYRALTVDRVFTAALSVGNARAAYDAALTYARDRSQFGQPIGKFQAVQFKLVDMLAQIESARVYTYHVAALADQGKDITKEAALAKLVAADGCHEVCNKALNIFGGYGLMNEFPAQRYLRDSYFTIIGGGTSDIMRLIIARQIGL